MHLPHVRQRGGERRAAGGVGLTGSQRLRERRHAVGRQRSRRGCQQVSPHFGPASVPLSRKHEHVAKEDESNDAYCGDEAAAAHDAAARAADERCSAVLACCRRRGVGCCAAHRRSTEHWRLRGIGERRRGLLLLRQRSTTTTRDKPRPVVGQSRVWWRLHGGRVGLNGERGGLVEYLWMVELVPVPMKWFMGRVEKTSSPLVCPGGQVIVYTTIHPLRPSSTQHALAGIDERKVVPIARRHTVWCQERRAVARLEGVADLV